MARRVAVVGAGMTRFVRRAQETGKELAWEASREALASCELPLDRIDAVCLTSAPDAFDGVHMKGEYLSDGAGAFGRPYMRTYVGGGSGVFTAIQAYYTVASGMADVVLAVAEEKMSSTQPHPQGAFLTIFDNILERPLGPNLLWIFALEMNRYMTVHGIDKRDIAAVAVKNKRNAADHPAALLGQADITIEDVLASETLAWPVQRLDVSPISDGAVAVVVASEEAAKQITSDPVWIQGVGWNLDTAYWTNRDLVFPEYVANAARMAYGMAGVTEPRKQIHVAEPYDPFDYKELHHLEGLLLFDKGKAPEAARDGVLDRKGDLPSCPSGGLLGVGNPIAAAGLMKIAELFWQLRGEAGARQVPGTPERGVAQAWGDLMQVGTVVVMGREGGPPTTATQLETPPTATPGHSLSDAEFRSATGAVDDEIGARYAWDAGVAIGRFLDGLRDGTIWGRECRNCERVLVPPRMFCERCFRGTDAWKQVENTGVVQTFSICNVRWDMQPLDEPELPAVIAIDGSDGGLLHARRSQTRRGHDRDEGGSRLEAGRRTHRFDPRHRVLQAAERRLMLEKIARPELIRRWEGTCPSATAIRRVSRATRSSRRSRSAASFSARGASTVRTRTFPRGCSASAASPNSPPTPRSAPAASSSRSRSCSRGSRASRWISPRRSAPFGSTARMRC